ncbi:uncharacterized protein LOC115896367 [Rhinopithecus roxellana]|nr:uncharacterized protein LOC115896367 [Rhinopithecus roxellana]
MRTYTLHQANSPSNPVLHGTPQKEPEPSSNIRHCLSATSSVPEGTQLALKMLPTPTLQTSSGDRGQSSVHSLPYRLRIGTCRILLIPSAEKGADSYVLSERSFERTYNCKLLSHMDPAEDEPGVLDAVARFGNLQTKIAGRSVPSPAPGGSPRDRRLEARRRDSDRGSREEEPEEAAGGSGPGEGRARGCSDRGRRREASPSSGRTAANRQVDPSSLRREERVSQDPGMGGKKPWGATSLHPGGEEAGGRRSAGAEPPTPGAEHAAPACSARVHRAGRGGDRAEAVAPGRCLGPDRLHVSPARGHVHRLSPVRRPDVLRINKMKLGETGGQIAPGSQSPRPGRSTSPPYPSPAAAPTPDRSPRGKLQP